MKRLYIEKSNIQNVLKAITEEQTRKKIFVNVAVKPYHGKKYNSDTTVVVCVG